MPEDEDKEAAAPPSADQKKAIPKRKRRGAGPRKTTRRPRANAGSASERAAGKEWTFPKSTLERAIELAQAIEEKNAGKPIKAEHLAPMVGFRKATDWRFLDILRSANQYALVTGTGASATVALTDTGADIVAPSSPVQRQAALLKAFNAVDLFQPYLPICVRH
jgi:hypothetical protein